MERERDFLSEPISWPAFTHDMLHGPWFVKFSFTEMKKAGQNAGGGRKGRIIREAMKGHNEIHMIVTQIGNYETLRTQGRDEEIPASMLPSMCLEDAVAELEATISAPELDGYYHNHGL